jgi:hypothetical protein
MPQPNVCYSTHHLRHSKKNMRNSSPLTSSLRSSATSASVHHREFSSSENTVKPCDANEVSITPSVSLAYKGSARLRPQAPRQFSEALLKLPAVSIRTSVLVRCRQFLTPPCPWLPKIAQVAQEVHRRGREIDERIRSERDMANKMAKKLPKKLPNKQAKRNVIVVNASRNVIAS